MTAPAARRIRHAGHFRRQMVGGALIGRPARGDGSIGTSPAPLLLEVHSLRFDACGRLALRQSVQRLLDECVDRIPSRNAECHDDYLSWNIRNPSI